MQSENELIGLGLVGLGKIARDQHLPAIRGHPGFRLIATASPGDKVQGVAGYDCLEEMLAAQPAIQAVALCTPPQVRFELASKAIAAGLHVLLEKPPAATLEQAAQLWDLARRKGTTLYATWHSRESECVDRAREWLSGKTAKSVMIEWREDIRRWHPGQDWILAGDGFGVFDPGINALSILTALFPGSIELVKASLAIPCNRAAPIAAALDLLVDQGVPASASFDFLNAAEQVWDIRVDTDQGQLRLTDGGHGLIIDGTEICRCDDREYAGIYRRFAGLIRESGSDVDLRPLEIASAATARGKVTRTEAFEF